MPINYELLLNFAVDTCLVYELAPLQGYFDSVATLSYLRYTRSSCSTLATSSIITLGSTVLNYDINATKRRMVIGPFQRLNLWKHSEAASSNTTRLADLCSFQFYQIVASTGNIPSFMPCRVPTLSYKPSIFAKTNT